MKLLLTGGAGYVGSACLRWLLKCGHDPVAYDDLSLGNAWSVPEDRLVVGSILDAESMRRALGDHQIEAVIHFAGLAVVPESVSDPADYWRTNVVGTKTVLDAMRKCGVAKIVFSSTCAVYGEQHPSPLDEGMPCSPAHPYGSTKFAAERIIRDYTMAYGIGHTILRYFNVAGADPDGAFGEHRRKETHLIPLTLMVAAGERDEVLIFGDDWPTPDGACVRDYIHTDDLAFAHQLAVERLEPRQAKLYNVGTGRGVSVLEVLRAAEAVVGRPIPHRVVSRRAGDPAALFARADKIRAELDWQPRYLDIQATIATAWNWQRNLQSRLNELTA